MKLWRNQAEVQTRGGKDSCRLGKGKGHQPVCLSVPKKRTWQEGLDNTGEGCKNLPKTLGWVGENQSRASQPHGHAERGLNRLSGP